MRPFPDAGTFRTGTSRPFLPIFLLFLGTLAVLYHLVPIITYQVGTRLQLPHFTSACAQEVGDGLCCNLFLKAGPCVEQCREKHLDRETFTLTNEYDECADKCLVAYKGTCQGREGEKRKGLIDDSLDERSPSGVYHVVDDDFSTEGGAGLEGPNVPDE